MQQVECTLPNLPNKLCTNKSNSKMVSDPQGNLVTAPSGLLVPPTPFERRMEELGRMFPPPRSHPAYKFLTAKAKVATQRDISSRLWVEEAQKKTPSFVLTRMKGGSQFPGRELSERDVSRMCRSAVETWTSLVSHIIQCSRELLGVFP